MRGGAHRAGQASIELILGCAVVLLAAALVTRGVAASLPTASPRPIAQAPIRADAPAVLPGDGDARAVVAIATSLLHIGIHEQGPDRGAWVDRFTERHAEPWCADFVSWVWMTAGQPFVGGVDGWRIASAPSLQAWFERRDRFLPRGSGVPAPGDVISFVHEHVGIVIAASMNDLDTIEGNSGDAVSLRHYHLWRDDPDIAGFGRAPLSLIGAGNFPTLPSV